jgi:hypothetical protein
MGSKVIHVSDELHTLVREYCDRNGYQIRPWADEALREAIEGKTMKKEPPADPVPVQKKKPMQTTGEQTDDGPKPWERPPFWERRGKGRADRADDGQEEKTPTPAPQEEGEWCY